MGQIELANKQDESVVEKEKKKEFGKSVYSQPKFAK